jgi:hypothetical protein
MQVVEYTVPAAKQFDGGGGVGGGNPVSPGGGLQAKQIITLLRAHLDLIETSSASIA